MAAMPQPPSSATPLIDWPLGQSMLLCDVVSANPVLRRRLAELGLRRGTRVIATQRTTGGGRVVASGDMRVALDRHAAASLRVIVDEPPAA